MAAAHTRYSPRDKAVVRAAKERAGYKCESCGSGYRIQAHHLRPISRGGATDLDNLQVLCFDCHRRAHRKGTDNPWFAFVHELQYGD